MAWPFRSSTGRHARGSVAAAAVPLATAAPRVPLPCFVGTVGLIFVDGTELRWLPGDPRGNAFRALARDLIGVTAATR